jgi:hypothetical protein
MISAYSVYGMQILKRAENFWDHLSAPTDIYDLLRFSAMMGIFPFSGYLFNYTIVGRIWSTWPYINTTMTVQRGLMCATLQWIFFVTFPILSSLILDILFRRWRVVTSSNDWTLILTYSMTPLYLAAMFVGIPIAGRMFAVLGMSTFLYLVYFGIRLYLRQNIIRSLTVTFAVLVLFGFVRQVFVYVIGF